MHHGKSYISDISLRNGEAMKSLTSASSSVANTSGSMTPSSMTLPTRYQYQSGGWHTQKPNSTNLREHCSNAHFKHF